MTKATDQVGALCYRRAGKKSLRVLLVTSRQTRRWVIPKGWSENAIEDYRAAAREALEEAGVVGQVETKPIGVFEYDKRENMNTRKLTVTVFPLRVKKLRPRWKERHERKRKWFSVSAAAKRVDEPGLSSLIRSYFKQLDEQ